MHAVHRVPETCPELRRTGISPSHILCLFIACWGDCCRRRTCSDVDSCWPAWYVTLSVKLPPHGCLEMPSHVLHRMLRIRGTSERLRARVYVALVSVFSKKRCKIPWCALLVPSPRRREGIPERPLPCLTVWRAWDGVGDLTSHS